MTGKTQNLIRICKILIFHPQTIFKVLIVLFTEGPVEVGSRLKPPGAKQNYIYFLNNEYKIWFKQNYLSKSLLKKQTNESKKFILQPQISLVLPTYNTPEKYLKECIDSVINQTYRNWQLCIADDASTDVSVRKIIISYAKKDQRIEYILREKNGHISQASNSALSIANGEFVGLLDHDDLLWPNALFEVVKKINQNPKVEFIYSDEDKLDFDGKTHLDPFFKPDWSPNYFRTVNYITHFTVIKKVLIDKVGGFRVGVEGTQDWDLFLRVTEGLSRDKIAHIPTILYSWRKSNQSAASEVGSQSVKKYAYLNQKKALADHLLRLRINAKIIPTNYLGWWRIKYDLTKRPLISIVIPTKDNYQLIKKSLNSLLQKTSYENFQLIIVDTGSVDPQVWKFYDKITELHKNTLILKWTKEFNFSFVCNFGAQHSKGEYLLFLNNDTEIITHEWIENMLEHAQREEVGAVGCKLLFPDNSIQHSGVVMGFRVKIKNRFIRVPGHIFKNFKNSEINQGYGRMVDAVRESSGVTGACLMVAKAKFLSVGGFDPAFRIAFNDVDFCLKLLHIGLLNIYTPFSRLYHHESVSVKKIGEKGRSLTEFLAETKLLNQRWGKFMKEDPYYNKNYTLDNLEGTLKI